MRRTTLLRIALVVCLLAALLVGSGSVSLAQGPGSELVEAVSADLTGPEASIALESVEAFAPEGGEAVFEPGSSYEEAFKYTSVDTEANRLAGLTRPAPLAHSAGVFVAVPAMDPTPSPTTTSSGEEEPAPESGAAESDESGGIDDPCTTPLGDIAGCQELLDEIPTIGVDDPCDMVTDQTCEETVQEILDDTSGDPCMILMDQTCNETIDEVLEDIDPDNVCDPDNTGQTCLEMVDQTCELLLTDSCVDILVGLINDPPGCDTDSKVCDLVPEEGCDLIPNRENSCYSTPPIPQVLPEDIDPVDTALALAIGEDHPSCEASAGMSKKKEGPVVILDYFGAFNCKAPDGSYIQHATNYATGCVKFKPPGEVWHHGPCAHDYGVQSCCVSARDDYPTCTDISEDESGVWRYRPWAHGWAYNAEGVKRHEDTDRGWDNIIKVECQPTDSVPPLPYPGI